MRGDNALFSQPELQKMNKQVATLSHWRSGSELLQVRDHAR